MLVQCMQARSHLVDYSQLSVCTVFHNVHIWHAKQHSGNFLKQVPNKMSGLRYSVSLPHKDIQKKIPQLKKIIRIIQIIYCLHMTINEKKNKKLAYDLLNSVKFLLFMDRLLRH